MESGENALVVMKHNSTMKCVGYITPPPKKKVKLESLPAAGQGPATPLQK